MNPLSILNRQQMLFDSNFLDFNHPQKEAIQSLILSSDFAGRHIRLLKDALAKDDLSRRFQRKDYDEELGKTASSLDERAFSRALRLFRHWHLLRIQLRELAGISTTEMSLRDWSDCADAMIMFALQYCLNHQSQKFGQPMNIDGEISRLLVLGMGKLGGQELNYSSDIDLIFAYTENGSTHHAPLSISNQEYFTKTVQQFVGIFQNLTADGFVFRVDLRLRPNGDSGPLVFCLTAMETYYQEQGRDWERYAMVKARLLNPEHDSEKRMASIIEPFVYRRYIDFSVLESLRGMKALIEREVGLKNWLNDIKRGQGGIREIEFTLQNIQLIRGGRLPQIRQQNALLTMSQLDKAGLLAHPGVLKQAYLFLRKLENCIQILNDQQTHSLPKDEQKQQQIALAMNYSDWGLLEKQFIQYQRIIHGIFLSTLKKVDSSDDNREILLKQLSSLWSGHFSESMAINLLASLGYEHPARCYQLIYEFRHSSRCRRLSQAARIRLERFMNLLMTELAGHRQTDQLLLKVIQLLEAIVGRSAYLALLTENPYALKELLHWFIDSPFITELLLKHPFLLEALLEQQPDWQPLTQSKLREKLQFLLEQQSDPELKEETLRHFKLTQWFFAARAECNNDVDALRVSEFLTDIATVILQQLLDLACQHLAPRYPEIEDMKNHFAVVAYGKAGSCEMNFDSDLDLVFLHRVSADQEPLLARLTQKMLHMLTTRTQAGMLYKVDTRLRPSGSAGLLISHIDAFKDYQLSKAWVWEHQALVKARIIIGNNVFKQFFKRLKSRVFTMTRQKETLRNEILAMRSKMLEHRSSFYRTEGDERLLDLEFFIQYLVLSEGRAQLACWTKPLDLIHRLYQLNRINTDQYSLLEAVYRGYHYYRHQKLLRGTLDFEMKREEDLSELYQQLSFDKS